MIDRHACPDPPEVAHHLAGFEGGLAFDVGANFGQSACVLAGNFDRVVSLEPCRESFDGLIEAVPENVTCLPVAASKADGVVRLSVSEAHLKQGQLTSATEDGPDESGTWGRLVGHRTVGAVRLDSLVADFGLPDLVKIDVEGHEVDVVAGALNLLATREPDLWIEIHGVELGVTVRGMLDRLYGDRLKTIRHPYYAEGSSQWHGHYWLLVG